MQRQRDLWVDLARGIGILLVVYGHISRGLYNANMLGGWTAYELLDSIIYCFHMPLFFFLSGLYFYPALNKYGRAGLVREKLASLAYPYLLWSLLQGGLELLAARYTNGQTSLADLYSILWRPHAQFWFLYILLLLSLLMAGLSPLRPAATVWLLPVALICWFSQLWQHWSFPLDFLVNYWLYFLLGCLAPAAVPLIRRYVWATVLASSSAFLLLTWYFHGPLQLLFSAYSWLHLPLAIAGILMVCSICMLAERLLQRPDPGKQPGWVSALQTLGVCSMPVFLMHILVGSGVRIVLAKLFHIQQAWLHLGLGLLLACWLPVLLYRAVQRNAPAALGWLFAAPSQWRSKASRH